MEHNHIYSARRPGLVVKLNIACILFIMIWLPLHILAFEILWQNNGVWHEYWEIAANFTVIWALFGLLLLRIFASFYDFHIAHVLSETQWKSILNEELNRSQPFLLKHRNLLGILSVSVLSEFYFVELLHVG